LQMEMRPGNCDKSRSFENPIPQGLKPDDS
jgi:hypothetical protein